MRNFAERWRPYRGLALVLLLRRTRPAAGRVGAVAQVKQVGRVQDPPLRSEHSRNFAVLVHPHPGCRRFCAQAGHGEHVSGKRDAEAGPG